MWNLNKKIQMNLFTKQKGTRRLKDELYGYQSGEVGKLINWVPGFPYTYYCI